MTQLITKQAEYTYQAFFQNNCLIANYKSKYLFNKLKEMRAESIVSSIWILVYGPHWHYR